MFIPVRYIDRRAHIDQQEPTLPPTPVSPIPTTGVKRRTLVGAAAWTAPAIVLASAAPAYATSTLGLITFIDPEDIIGSGYTATLTVQLTVPAGGSVPSSVNIRYGTPNVLRGPTSAPTGGNATFTFQVTALDVNASTEITVRAPGYVDGTTTITVTADRSGFLFLQGFSFRSTSTQNKMVGSPVRTTSANGTVTDSFRGGEFKYNGLGDGNALNINGFLLRSDMKAMAGVVEFNLDVFAVGYVPNGVSSYLLWQNSGNRPNSGKPITEIAARINGKTARDGSLNHTSATAAGTNGILPILRGSTTTASRPGGYLYLAFTFPRFPGYTANVSFVY